MSLVRFRPEAPDAGVAHPVERHLAKVEVASSSLVTRSKKVKERVCVPCFIWYRSQVVRPRSAKPLFASSNLAGTSKKDTHLLVCVFFAVRARFERSNAIVQRTVAADGLTEANNYFSSIGRKMQTNLAGTSINFTMLTWLHSVQYTPFVVCFYFRPRYIRLYATNRWTTAIDCGKPFYLISLNVKQTQVILSLDC